MIVINYILPHTYDNVNQSTKCIGVKFCDLVDNCSLTICYLSLIIDIAPPMKFCFVKMAFGILR